MARTNGKSEVEPRELDTEHELPASEDAGDSPQSAVAAESPAARPSGESAELQKLRAERDTLLDRSARLQAEFENARKRTAREQQDFREYALTDTVRTLLPILDSFERALQVSSAEKSELRGGVELIYKQLQDALSSITTLTEYLSRSARESSLDRVSSRNLRLYRPVSESRIACSSNSFCNSSNFPSASIF